MYASTTEKPYSFASDGTTVRQTLKLTSSSVRLIPFTISYNMVVDTAASGPIIANAECSVAFDVVFIQGGKTVKEVKEQIDAGRFHASDALGDDETFQVKITREGPMYVKITAHWEGTASS